MPTRDSASRSYTDASGQELVEAWHGIKKSIAAISKHDAFQSGWLEKFSNSVRRIQELSASDPDVALYMLLQAATSDLDGYSTNHALFCAVVAELCATYFEWPEEEASALRCAALTMNVGMLQLQDAMSHQASRPSPAQQLEIAAHPAKSVALLQRAGVVDSLWLETVRRHHCPINDLEVNNPITDSQRLAILLQRIDVFTAKLSKRKTRPGTTATIAAREACLDRSGLPDATGATILRVVGLYPPGSFVRLISGEIGIVVRRGSKAHTPVVVSVRRSDGATIANPKLRHTSFANYSVQCAMSAADVNIRLDHERIISAGRE